MDLAVPWLAPQNLAAMIEDNENLLVVDSRSFLEYNDGHILGSVNIQSSQLIRKRLEKNKLSINDLLKCSQRHYDTAVVYDQNTTDVARLSKEHFLWLVAKKLTELEQVISVFYLKGGFVEFAHRFPRLCETKKDAGNLFSISAPCLSDVNVPITKILPFLYLGSAEDSQNVEPLKSYGIEFIMNVSVTAPDSPHVIKTNYMKIPVQDSTSENLVDWFQSAFNFIDQVKGCDGKVLIHCVGGVSRSATIAVGYVMKHLQLPLDTAYRLVKEKRPTISPNLNFMGQLLQFEKQLVDKGDIQTNLNNVDKYLY